MALLRLQFVKCIEVRNLAGDAIQLTTVCHFLRFYIQIEPSNRCRFKQSTLLSCCLHDGSHAGKLGHVHPHERTYSRLIILVCALQLSDPSDRGCWAGLARVARYWVICLLNISSGRVSDLAQGQDIRPPMKRRIEGEKIQLVKCFLPFWIM